MSGIVVLPFLKVLHDKLKSLLVESTASIYSLKGDLEDTVLDLELMAAIAQDAEQRAKHGQSFKSWLESLQDMLYEADDLIDEVQIMLNQVSSPSSSLLRRVKHNSLLKSKLAPPLKLIRQEMQQISAYYPKISVPVDVSQRRVHETHSFVDPREVMGRERDEHEVMELILTCDVKADHKVSVVPIVGSLAIGKTTLAQLIYNNSKINAHFHRKLWLSLVGCHDIFHFLKMLSYQLRGGNLEEDGGDIEPMKMKLSELLKNKRSLIVLDDFKDNDLHKSLARELTDELSEGSAIILTTRSRKAARFIGTTPAYQLQPLSPDASYQLFACTAFSRGIEEHSEYKHIGRELVKLCSGIPLLLKVIGSLLRFNHTVMEWRRFLEIVHDHGFANIREDIRFNDDIFEIPSHLKYPLQCFRLQKACGLSVEALTCVWMALGFLYSPDDRTTQPPAEYIAREYLNEFVESALWPDVEYAPGGVVRHIKFHDALYDLATMSGNPWWHVVHDEKKFDGSPMYIIWDQDCLEGTLLPSDHIRNPNKVRLFLVSSSTRRQASLGFVSDVVSCFQRLRVLGLGGCDVEMLPHSIVKLKHLRYLDVGRNPRMKTLPDSICKLWHLQTLFLHGCSQLEELPAKIGRLQNLRYLTLTILKKILPDAIGQLTSLRTFGLTNCPRLTSLPSSIKNLKSLEMLAIVKCPELDLASTSSVEAFKGLDAIHTLLLSQLPKFASLPSQLGNLSATLKHLQILFCSSLTEVKWITQFRSLHSLTIEDCPLLSDLTLTDGDSQLNGLSELIIGSCPSLRYTAWIRQFVSLQTLIIDDCPELVVLDDEFSELKILRKLQIRGCPGFTKWFASLAGKDWCHNVDLEVIEIDGEGLKS